MIKYTKEKIESSHYPLLKHQEDIINLYVNKKLSCKSLSTLYNVNPSSISRLLKRNGIILRSLSHSRQKYSINENVFSSIDSYEKAYWLGLLYADGHHNPEKHEIKISLQEGDKILIEKLKEFLEYSGPIKLIEFKKHPTWKNQYGIMITNKKISNDLLKLGLIKDKTFNVIFPRWLQKKYYSSFILGYFDGDGTLSYNKKTNQLYWQIVGTIDFIEVIRSYFIKVLKTSEVKFSDVRTKNPKVKVLRYGGNQQVLRISDWMYKDASIFLKRKKDKLSLIL